MIFDKPEGVGYTHMCKYIDDTAYTEECDDEIVYKYLYLIIDMLCKKQKYFSNEYSHEDFVTNSTNYVYFRIKKTDAPRIRNTLDYLKTSLPLLYINYTKRNKKPKEISYEKLCEKYGEDPFKRVLDSTINELRIEDFQLYLDNICKTIKNFIRQTPYGGTAEERNLYISCLLSLLNRITLRKRSIKYLGRECKKTDGHSYTIEKLYNKEKEDFVIVYHLDESMHDYIHLLTSRIMRLVCKDLDYIAKQGGEF